MLLFSIASRGSGNPLPPGYSLVTDGSVIALIDSRTMISVHSGGPGDSVVALDVSEPWIAICQRTATGGRFFAHHVQYRTTDEFASLEELESKWKKLVERPLQPRPVADFGVRDLDWW